MVRERVPMEKGPMWGGLETNDNEIAVAGEVGFGEEGDKD